MSNENVELAEKPNKIMSLKNKRKFSTEEWKEEMAIRRENTGQQKNKQKNVP